MHASPGVSPLTVMLISTPMWSRFKRPLVPVPLFSRMARPEGLGNSWMYSVPHGKHGFF